MFNSKPIGWITALTVLCVAGVALACRLKEGSGNASRASSVVCADADKKEKETSVEPPALPTLPPPATIDAVPPPPALNAALAPPEPIKVGESVVPGPLPVVSSAPPSVTAPPKFEASPLPPSGGVPAGKEEKKIEIIGTVHIPAPPLPTADKKAERPVPAPLAEAVAPAPLTPAAKVPMMDRPPSAPVADNAYWTPTGGETLREIARKKLGDGERWTEILKLNPDVRPESVVPGGTMIRLPGEVTSSGIVRVSGPAGTDTIAPAMLRTTTTTVKPLPVIRAKPEDGSGVVPMTGTFECKIDGQHALVVPKEVCDQMGACKTMLLTPGPDRCLWLVSQTAERRMLHRIEKAQVTDAEVQAFKRLYFSQTMKASMDATGSFKVPEKFVEYGGLTGEVVLIGMDDHFEMWDAARWHQYSQQKSSTKIIRTSDE